MRIALLTLVFLIAGCATADVSETGDGSLWITGHSDLSMPRARHALIRKASETCPDGYEILDERSSLGLTATVSRRIRCRED